MAGPQSRRSGSGSVRGASTSIVTQHETLEPPNNPLWHVEIEQRDRGVNAVSDPLPASLSG